MADVASILSVSARGSQLSLDLWKAATRTAPGVTDDFSSLGKSVSNLCLTIKQVGSLIVENDRLPSPEAISDLEDILNQSKSTFQAIRTIIPAQIVVGQEGNGTPNPTAGSRAKLAYLSAHIDSLKSTLSVILQTLYTVQVISWTRTGPMTAPQSPDATIADQETQLEALVIEQQLSFLHASKRYEKWRWRDRQPDELSMASSLVAADDRGGDPKLADLLRYQHRSLVHLDTSHAKDEWLGSICEVSNAQVDHLIKRWTLLHELETLSYEEQLAMKERKRRSQQPTVESDSSDDDDLGELPRIRLATPHPRRSKSAQKISTDPGILPIPGSSLHTGDKLSVPTLGRSMHQGKNSALDLPEASQADNSASPIAAAAAVEAKEDGDVGLKIPWTLCTRDHYWKHIDGKMIKSDTLLPASTAYSDRTSFTEIDLSWVCKEALREAKYSFTQMQKLRRDGERTKMEPTFRIDTALTFEEVNQLVERTVETYRRNQPPTTPPRSAMHESFAERMQAQQTNTGAYSPHLRHSFSSYNSTTRPISLDRSASMSGPTPTAPPRPGPNPNASSPHLQHYPSNPQPTLFAPSTHLPIPPPPPLQIPQYQPNSTYPPYPNSAPPQFNQNIYQPHLAPGFQHPHLAPHFTTPAQPPASPSDRRRPSHQSTRSDRRDSGASDTDDSVKHRRRRGSRRDRDRDRDKDHHLSTKHVKRMGTLATVGGLAALLEGL
ncbi:hypothetical protein BDV96DRAFT_689707 [Lophiotrema nucula]|uniref:Fungal N-terminal domain-containing protein n=1 Tax=Lophiotrema nucula TaxID=690887 RepID=A0A6A5YZ64_9PLEO|nr:hypothetical protein BDV96DRAFT_689707 [Lophiotrema nucula]